MHKRVLLSSIFLIFLTNFVIGQEPIPNSKGFHGFFMPGIGYLRFRNNQVAQFMSYQLNESQIEAIDKAPDAQNNMLLTFPLEIGYTIVPYKTHVFIGNQIEDLIRFDVSQQLGVKQRFKSYGVLQFGLLYTGLPTKVWEDPFLTNEDRVATKRTALGLQLVWDQIGNSGLRVQYTYRDVVVNNENSGLSLGLSDEDMKLLIRSGDMHELNVQYRFFFKQKHRVTPEFDIVRDKRKGAARSRTKYDLAVNYVLANGKTMFISNALIGYALYDEKNPIYDIRQDDIRYGLSGSIYQANPFGWVLFGDKPFRLVFTAAYNYVDANIEFYQQRGVLLQFGVFTKW